ncbi:aminoglycoside phosphotransferase [Lentzea sp. NPDC058436]|uniref:aminoglycoside phosphotransferase n=1 Tax=Lentzea sp. NPDC058436 TaxID=3346499 RepID=UPI00365B22D3
MPADLSDADAQFRQWMLENLHRAAAHFGLALIGEPRLGWMDRSIGVLAGRGDEQFWLRVVSENKQWISGDFWTGNLDANALTGLAKPRVLDVYEWEEHRQQRAEVLTLLPGSPCSRDDVLREPIDLPGEWWAELRRTLDVIASAPTERVNADQEMVNGRIRQRFGESTDATVDEWETVHGDLHWANLMRPDFGLLDWEWWGRGPAGTDAATLLSYSLLVPEVAERVRSVFGDVLESESGRLAQLYVASRLFRRMDKGDYPDLASELEAHIEALL